MRGATVVQRRAVVVQPARERARRAGNVGVPVGVAADRAGGEGGEIARAKLVRPDRRCEDDRVVRHVVRVLVVLDVEPLASRDELGVRRVEQRVAVAVPRRPHALVEDVADQSAHRVRLRPLDHRERLRVEKEHHHLLRVRVEPRLDLEEGGAQRHARLEARQLRRVPFAQVDALPEGGRLHGRHLLRRERHRRMADEEVVWLWPR